jgi:hypothetical protein
VALLVFGTFASRQQNGHAPISAQHETSPTVDGRHLGIVVGALVVMVGTNVLANALAQGSDEPLPFLAMALWAVLLGAAWLRRPTWSLLPAALRSGLFLLALVFAASLMPVDALPSPSWKTTFGLGVVSAMFDNIPLTKLALDQGGYDWGLLAYAVGFGGSMIWFGSSAGVTVATAFPEARSATRWLRDAWHVPLAYGLGFAAQVAVTGWAP